MVLCLGEEGGGPGGIPDGTTNSSLWHEWCDSCGHAGGLSCSYIILALCRCRGGGGQR